MQADGEKSSRQLGDYVHVLLQDSIKQAWQNCRNQQEHSSSKIKRQASLVLVAAIVFHSNAT